MTVKRDQLEVKDPAAWTELARRLGTSVPQVYRLLDPTNSTKSLAQLLALLHVVGFSQAIGRRDHRRRHPGAVGNPAQRFAFAHFVFGDGRRIGVGHQQTCEESECEPFHP